MTFRISRRFRDNMCFLMKPREGGKQPTSSMRRRLYSDIRNTKVSAFHRQERCTSRQRRDCAAIQQTREILRHFVALLISVPRWQLCTFLFSLKYDVVVTYTLPSEIVNNLCFKPKSNSVLHVQLLKVIFVIQLRY